MLILCCDIDITQVDGISNFLRSRHDGHGLSKWFGNNPYGKEIHYDAEGGGEQVELKHIRLVPLFAGAIGTVVSTHIPAILPVKEHAPFRNRGGGITQNVLAVVEWHGRS